MSIYAFNQPAMIGRYREATARQDKMIGVTMPTFLCSCCNTYRPLSGRTRVTKGTSKDGYVCSGCRPEAPPVAPKPVADVRVSKPTPEPAKARKTLMTDEQIIEARTDHEFGGVKAITLRRKYGVSENYMRRVLDYLVRSKLIPKQHRR